jgi:hypothetical protein
MVKEFKNCCISDEIDGRMRKKLGILVVNKRCKRKDGNCKNSKTEPDDRSGEYETGKAE